MKFVRGEPGRDGKILSDHRQDGKVAAGRIGNLARRGTSAVSEMHTKQTTIINANFVRICTEFRVLSLSADLKNFIVPPLDVPSLSTIE